MHLFDVHYDYAAPEEYWRRFNPDYEGDFRARRFMDNPRIRPGMDPDDHRQLMALYDGEIAWTDHHVGSMLESLERYGVADDTLVVLISDHGEEFFEHGGKGHRHTLYDEQLWVPFILRFPGELPSARRVGMQVRMIDVAPTLLDLLGVDPPRQTGTSLTHTRAESSPKKTCRRCPSSTSTTP